MDNKKTINLSYKIEIKDSNGEIRVIKEKTDSHSFVSNFLKVMREFLFDMSSFGTSITDVNGVTYIDDGEDNRLELWTYFYPEIGQMYSTCIGTGDASESNTDYALESLIAHGTGSGQMFYGGGTIFATVINGSSTELPFSREFANQSGDSIIVNEIGIATQGQYYNEGTGFNWVSTNFLVCRDVIDPVTIYNGSTLIVTYTITTTV